MALPVPCCLTKFSPSSAGPQRPASIRTATTPSQTLQLLSAWREGNLNSLLQTAWALLLYRYIGSQDVCFGFQNFGADGGASTSARRPDTESMSTFSLTINENASVQAILRDVQGKGMLGMESETNEDARIMQDGYMLFNTILMIRICCDSTRTSQETPVQPTLALTLPDEVRVRLHVKILEEDVSIFLEYWSEDMSSEQMKSIASYFEQLIGQILSAEDLAVNKLDWLSQRDWSRICNFNSLLLESHDRCIHQVIREQMLLRLDAEAVCSWDGSFTYRELDLLASQVAYHLQSLGVGPEVRVALCFDKSKWNIVAMLGVLKAGGAFVPLNPTHPTSRLRSMVRSIDAEIMLCSRNREEILSDVSETLIPLDHETLNGLSAPYEEGGPKTEVKSYNAAYVIFTSGSTGEPKGTLVEHGSYVSGAAAHGPALRVSSDSRMLQFAAHTFDASLIDMLTCLMQGGCMCIPSDEARLNNIEKAINEMGVNYASLTPSFVNFIDQSRVPGLKTLLLAGEAMSPSHLSTWSTKVNLVNGFGPTESSVSAVTNSNVTPTSDCRDIGLPTGIHCWVVNPNDHDQLVPVGCVGELLLEGPQLARCYINNPEKTAEVFIYNPAWAKSKDNGSSARRFYKTGDLVRYNSDAGALTYIGRKDTQVKVHGQRVELGEIEDTLNSDTLIEHGLAFLLKSGFSAGKLTAVISLSTKVGNLLDSEARPLKLLESSKKAAIVAEIRSRISSQLPTYMVPNVWLCVESLPMLASEKLDRKMTAKWVAEMEDDPDLGFKSLESISNDSDIRFANFTEDRLASIWGRVLNIPKSHISLDKSFLGLGGDSIAAITCMGVCKKQGLGITVEQVLRSKSIKHLATQVEEINHPTIYQEITEQHFSLSPIQKLHFMARKEGQGHFNQGILTHLNRQINENDLRSSVEALISRHSMLRARYTDFGTQGGMKQRITEDVIGSYQMRTHNVTCQDEIQQAIAESQSRINAFEGPILTVNLFNMDDGVGVLSMVAHHLVVDIVSWRIILEDLEDFLSNPHEASSQSGSLPFQSWNKLQAEQCQSIDSVDNSDRNGPSPTDFAYWGMENRQITYGDVDCEIFEIGAEDTHSLLIECHESLQTEPIDIFLASLLHAFGQAFTDRSLPVIYNEGHGREVWDSAIDISRTVGWFTILHAISISGFDLEDPVQTVVRVKDLRRRVSDNGRQEFARRTLNGNENQAHPCPMEITFNYVGQHRDLQRREGLFQLVNQMAGETGQGGGAADFGEETPRFALFEISAVAVQGRLRFTFSFNRYMKHQRLIRNWISCCHDLLKHLGTKLRSLNPRPTLSTFPMLHLTYDELNSALTRKLPSVGIDSPDLIEDIYPCSRMQEGILLSCSRDGGYYAVHDTFEVKCSGSKPDINRLTLAWQKVVSHHPMLRTVFVENFFSQNLFCQVVLKDSDACLKFVQCLKESDVLATLDGQQPMSYRDHRPPHRLTICQTATGKLYCRLEISHASMDGASIAIILRDLQLTYAGKLDHDPSPLFKNFISYLQDTPQAPSMDYWCKYLSNLKPCHFPVLNDGESPLKELKTMRLSFEHSKELQAVCDLNELTLSTAFSTAWGLTLRSFCGTEDICFIYLASLRDLPVEDIEWMVGPVINLLACRMKTPRSLRVKDILHQVQNDYMEHVPHRHISLIDIQHALKISDIALFNTGISFRKILPINDTSSEAIQFSEVGSIYDPSEFPLFVNIEVTDNVAQIELNYWTTALSDGAAKSVADAFLNSLKNIVYQQDEEIGLIDTLGDWTRHQLITWNANIFQPVEKCAHDFLDANAKLQPDSLAITGWDGSLTYAMLDQLSSMLAIYLVKLGVGSGILVPIAFGRSMWQIVAILAVVKAGGICVPMEESFLRSSIDQWLFDNEVQVALASTDRASALDGTIPYVIPVSRSIFQCLPSPDGEFRFSVQPSDSAYVVFTTGGSPEHREVLLNHRAILSRAETFGSILNTDQKTRMLLLSPCTSDMFLQELFGTLIHGGCLCIPPENASTDISASIHELQANCLCATPSMASKLNLLSVPEIQVLALFGENPIKEINELWSPRVQLHHFYGTAESSSLCIHTSSFGEADDGHYLGSSLGCISWLVDPSDHDILVPIGCTGELVIEGPAVSHSYLRGEKQSEQNFIENPRWISAFEEQTAREDDTETSGRARPSRRMFKTGDLARYNSDGTLVYMGKRNPRCQLETDNWRMEQRIDALLPPQYRCAVEMIDVSTEYDTGCLSVFIIPKMGTSTGIKVNHGNIQQTSSQFHEIVTKLHTDLQQFVPTGQVPSLYFPVFEMPLTPFGKLHRQSLRNSAQDLPGNLRLQYDIKKYNEFWRHALANTMPCHQFPPPPSRPSEQLAIEQIQQTERMLWSDPITSDPGKISAILSAWALTVYGYIVSEDICFGELMLEGGSSLADLSDSNAPSMTIVPRRFHVDETSSVAQLLSNVHQDVISATPFQRGGLQRIKRLSADTSRACNFTNLISISNVNEDKYKTSKELYQDKLQTELSEYPLAIFVTIGEEQVEFCSVYDGNTLCAPQVERIMTRFGDYLRFLNSEANMQVPISGMKIRTNQSLYSITTDIDYWTEYLADIEPCLFPSLTPAKSQSTFCSAEVEIKYASKVFEFCESSGVSAEFLLQVVWGLVLRCYTGLNDICFGLCFPDSESTKTQHDSTESSISTDVFTCRLNLKDDQNLKEVVQRNKQEFTEMLKHPISLVEVQQELGFDDTSLFNTVFKCEGSISTSDEVSVSFPWSSALDQSEYAIAVDAKVSELGGRIRLAYNTAHLSEANIANIIDCFDQILNSVAHIAHDNSIGDIEFFSDFACQQIRQWNATLPARPDKCAHEIIDQQRLKLPSSAPAICSWDGNYTYSDLEFLSTRLSQHLIGLGVKPEKFVALCFQKSAFAVIAQVAVLKAGGAFASLDPTHPEGRLKGLYHDIGADIILCSPKYHEKASKISDGAFVVTEDTINQLTAAELHVQGLRPNVNNAAYAIFTSGTTGKPKATVLEHISLGVASVAFARELRMNSSTRALQFSSYTFDVSVLETIVTLMTGGCICIPSEEERLNDLPGAIRRTKANLISCPPSITNSLDPQSVPDLKIIITGGEKMTTSHMERWSDRCVINAYGPSEATIVATSSMKMDGEGRRLNDDCSSIGTAICGRAWVVDPHNHHRLLPVGAVGELMLEGHNIARGYLNNDQKTKEVFIKDPRWTLRSGLQGILAHKERMYRSGDLVRYNTDGTLSFISRKDTQIKLNGQRIELEEIEQHCIRFLSTNTQVAVEVVTPESRMVAKCLAAFFTISEEGLDHDNRKNSSSSEILLPMSGNVADIVKRLHASLGESLPLVMIPKLFFPVRRLPFTTTGKLDRKGLRAMVEPLTKEQMQSYTLFNTGSIQVPEHGIAGTLKGLWEKALGLLPGSVSAEDSFFGLGGDSFSAMKLVGAAHSHGVSLTVSDIYASPVLVDMAKCCKISATNTNTPSVEPFSLLPTSVSREEVLEEVSNQCRIPEESISDVYPCSPVQEGLLTLSMKQQGAYVARPIFQLSESVDVKRFKSAWQQAVDDLEILRTRIVHTDSMSFVQAVLHQEPISWTTATSLEELADDTFEPSRHNGGQLSSYAMINPTASSQRYFVWTIHHALYDGWSVPLILKRVEEVYSSSSAKVASTLPYKVFIHHLLEKDMSQSDEFWKSQFSNLSSSPFPQSKSSLLDAIRVGNQHHNNVSISRASNDVGLTLPEIIRAAWAIVVSVHTNSSDVCFGETLMGRNIDLPGTTDIAGPVLTTVPTRLNVDSEILVTRYLQNVHELATMMIPHQHSGLQRIRRLSSDAALACDFQNLLVIQPDDGKLVGDLWTLEDPQSSGEFFTHPLTVECKIGDSNLGIVLHHDEVVIDSWQAERLVHQFSHVIEQLLGVSNGDLRKLSDLEVCSTLDKKDIALWNQRNLPSVERCAHEIIREQFIIQPKAQAICAWDAQLSYGEMYALASSFGAYLSSRGIGPESLVPICMDKSAWAVICILGVLIAGGGFVPLDPSHPTSRHLEILEEVDARIILCSPEYRSRYTGSVKTVIPVSKETLKAYGALTKGAKCFNTASPSNAAFAIFTSGSTGRPKGIIIEHRALASSGMAFAPLVHLNKDSRVFQFASLAFDAAVMEVVITLMRGGCICMPSEDERLNDVVGAMQRMNVSWAFLTPAIASIIEPSKVPYLKVLTCGGEKLSREVLTRWTPHLNLINVYGPTETTIFALLNAEVSSNSDPACIGHGIPCTLVWVVDPENHDRLSPLGSVGELALEGPALAREYLKNPEKTADSFVSNPAWMQGFPSSLPSPRRIYKTGDLVRYNPDGSIEYVSRKDHQVKLHGQRMELGEIEHRLHEDPLVRHAVVAMPKVGFLKERLVTILSLESLASDTSLVTNGMCELVGQDMMKLASTEIAAIQGNLEAQLPVYMVPQTWAVIKKLPMLISGKLDRKRITQWVESVDEQTSFNIMQGNGSLEQENTNEKENSGTESVPNTLREIFGRMLNIPCDKIDLNRSFVSLGGDSITGMAVVSRARKHGLDLTLHNILQSKSINELALTCGAKIHATQHVEKSGELFSLSPIQELYFQTANALHDKARFNQSMTVRVTRRTSPDILKRAVRSVVDYHSMFRARFTRSQSGNWQQRITDDKNTCRFRTHSVRSFRDMFPKIAETQQSLDIRNGAIFAADLFEVDTAGQILFLVAHHLCVDMVSWRIILQDMEEFIESGSLPSEKPLSFQNWSAVQLNHIQSTTSDIRLPFAIEPPNLDYWGMEQKENVYGHVKMETFALNEKTTTFLLESCHQVLRAEAIDVVLSAVIHSFRRVFTDRKIPTIYNEGHGREFADLGVDLSRTVGWFTTMCPLQIDECPDILTTLKNVKDTRRKIANDGQAFFAQSLLRKGKERSSFPVPLEIIFNYLGQLQQLERGDSLFQHFGSTFDADNFDLTGDMGPETSRFALLEISAIIVKERLHVSFTYNQHMQRKAQILNWISECTQILEKDMLCFKDYGPEPTLSDYPLLPINYDGLRDLVKYTLPRVGVESWDKVEDIYPCSPVQEGILLSQLRDPSAYMFHVIFEVRHRDQGNKINPSFLRKAWSRVVDRHPVLRTVFIDSNYKGGSFDQLIVKTLDGDIIEFECDEANAMDALENTKLQKINSQRSTKLARHLTICKTSTGRVLVKIEINHAIIDGGSIDILLRDLALAYNNQLTRGSGPRFSDYIQYIRGQSQDDALAHWMRYLNEIRPCHLSFSGKTPGDRQLGSFMMSFNRFPELQDFCERNSVTLANLTLAAWAIVLRSFTGSDDVCFGYPSAGRDSPVPGIQDAIGIFINMLCCRVNFAANHTLLEISKTVQDAYIRSLPHQSCSLAQIQHELGRQGQTLFNTAISIQNHSSSKDSADSDILFDLKGAHDPTEYPVTVNVETGKGREGVLLRYWTDTLSDARAKDLADSMAKVFTCFIEGPSRLVSDLVLSGKLPHKHIQSQNGSEGFNEPVLTDLKMIDNHDLQKLIDNRVNEIISQMLKDGKLAIVPTQDRNISQSDTLHLETTDMLLQAAADSRQMALSDSIPTLTGDKEPSDIESQLWKLWGTILNVPEDSITRKDSFFKLGGDSITAMKLVGAAREEGLVLTVGDVFKTPVFEEMLAVVRFKESPPGSGAETPVEPLELDEKISESPVVISRTVSNEEITVLRPTRVDDISLQDRICPKVGVFKGGIADVLPVTDFQALSITATLLKSRWMLNYFFLDGNGPFDVRRLRESFLRVVDAFDILRTVFVCFHGQFFQVVLRKVRPEIVVCETEKSLDDYTASLQQRDRDEGPRQGEPYVQFYIVKKKTSDEHRIMIRMSHAQFDGICLPRIMSAIKMSYEGSPIPPALSFSNYMRMLPGSITPEHYQHWRTLLKGSMMTDIIRREKPNTFQHMGAFEEQKKTVEFPSTVRDNITIATIIQSAWAMTLAKLSAKSDVVFGLTINGRNTTIPGVESTVGPCLNNIPVRVKFGEKWTGLDLFRYLQDQQVANMPFESLGFRDIIKQCTDWSESPYFATSVFHQNIEYEGQMQLDSNNYQMGGAGVIDNFTDLILVSKSSSQQKLDISLGYSRKGPIQPAFATRVLDMVCETVQSLVANPSLMLPSPSTLRSLPCQVIDDIPRPSDEQFIASHLNNRNISELLVYSDVLVQTWHQVLSPRTSTDDNTLQRTFHLDSSFFEHGGDIFSMAQVVWLLEQEGLQVHLEDLLEHPTLLGQMAVLDLHNNKHESWVDAPSTEIASSTGNPVSKTESKSSNWNPLGKAMTLARRITKWGTASSRD